MDERYINIGIHLLKAANALIEGDLESATELTRFALVELEKESCRAINAKADWKPATVPNAESGQT